MPLRMSLALVPVLLLCALSAQASAAWRAPVTLDRGVALRGPSVALDASGRVAASWIGGGAVRALTPAGADVVVQASRGRLEGTAVALASRGRSVVAWTRSGRVETRRISPAGRLSLRSRLSGTGRGAFDPTWIGGSGGTVLAWLRGTSEPDLQIGVPRSDGAFEGTLRYDIAGLLDVDLVTTRSGGLVVFSTRAVGSDVELVVAEQRPGSARLRDFARIVTGGLPRDPAVVVTPTGRTVLAWTEADPVAGGERVMTTSRPRGGGFGTPVALATGVYASQLALIPKADGVVLASWIASQRAPETSPGPLVVTNAAGGPTRTVSGRGELVRRYTAASAAGGAWFAWTTDTTEEPGGPLAARMIDASERLRPRSRVSAPDERVVAFALTAGAAGRAAVLWTTAGGRTLRLARRVP